MKLEKQYAGLSFALLLLSFYYNHVIPSGFLVTRTPLNIYAYTLIRIYLPAPICLMPTAG